MRRREGGREEWTEDRRERVGEVGTEDGRFNFCS